MSDVTITSTTPGVTQAQLDHAASDNWRDPFIPEDEPKKEDTVIPAAEPEPEKAKPEAKQHKGGGQQKRIDKLTALNAKLEADLAEARAKVKPAEEQPTGPREPKLADFGNDVEKFLAARDQWKDAEAQRQSEQERQKVIFDDYNKKVSEARGNYDDWDEVVGAATNIKIPQAAYLAVVELENGPDVGYYLASHPEEASALQDMTPIGAIRAVTKISSRLEAEKTKPTVKEKVKPPEPISTVGNSATRGNIPLDQLSPREYIRVRNKQERENRR